jgi:hypothetical protein
MLISLPLSAVSEESSAMRTSIAGSLLGLALLLPCCASAADELVRCEDYHGSQLCRVPEIWRKHVELHRQLSHARCIRGKSWGTNRDGIWVDNGCRGDFLVTYRHGDRRGDRGWAYDHRPEYSDSGPRGGYYDPRGNSGWRHDRPEREGPWGRQDDPRDARPRGHEEAYPGRPGRRPDDRPPPHQAVPRSAEQRCHAQADAVARYRFRAVNVSPDRVRSERTGFGYRLLIDYHLVLGHDESSRRAVCEVSRDGELIRFEFE